jgi:hypothetical protein
MNAERKLKQLQQISTPQTVQRRAREIYGKDTIIYVSPLKSKKYRIRDLIHNKWVDFGQFDPPMEDFTKHKDKERRMSYLSRSLNIKGKWRENPYSPNNLSIFLLW